MEFTHEFTVPADVETTWRTLTDLERVAPCLPGAQFDEVEDGVHRGRVKIKVGPVAMTYQGTAELVEADDRAKRARIDARGREARGSGTASADVLATLAAGSTGTTVRVVTDLQVTGKPAQFGRGVMQDVGTKVIDQFARRLEQLLEEDGGTGAADGTPSRTGAGRGDAVTPLPVGAPGPPEHPSADERDDDALDLVGVAGAATAKRVVPVVLALLVVAAIIRRLVRD